MIPHLNQLINKLIDTKHKKNYTVNQKGYTVLKIILVFILGSSALASDKYTEKKFLILKRPQVVNKSYVFRAFGEINEEKSKAGSYIISFPKDSLTKWPQTITLTLPLASNEQVKAYKIPQTTNHIHYKFSYYQNSLSGAIGKTSLKSFTSKIYRIPLKAIYSPDGKVSKVFILNNGEVELVKVRIHSSDSNYIYTANQLKNVFLSHQSYLLPGQTINAKESLYE